MTTDVMFCLAYCLSQAMNIKTASSIPNITYPITPNH